MYWAGRLTTASPPATTLPGGTRIEATDAIFGGVLRDRLASSLPGDPRINGVPCVAVYRPYTCRGNPLSAASVGAIRFKTDAPVIELTGVIPDTSYAAFTLMVDGKLVPPVTLSSSRGNGGGYLFGSAVIDFDTRAMRDIYIELWMPLAYVTVGATDTVLPPNDHDEPRMSVVGDSYLQARSVSFCNGGAIALEIGARLGIRNVATDAIGGTGYYDTGNDLGNLNDRLPAHGGDNSILYLVTAGLNDYGDVTSIPLPKHLNWPTRAAYEQSVFDYLKNLRLAQPKALIVVTAPFCPTPPQSDSTYKANSSVNTSALGDFLYVAGLHKAAVQAIDGPWVYVDVLMGGGWLNSSGKTGDITGLQWFTGGTPGYGTSATYKPGNTLGGGGGGYGGIASVPIISGGTYTQGPEITATGGTGKGLQLQSVIDGTGKLIQIHIVQAGYGYTAGTGLPTLHIDPTYETTPAILGTPALTVGVNPNGAYPLPEFAPLGTLPSELNNIFTMLVEDLVHPSPVGVEYLSTRLARNIYQAVMDL